jgi:hypothetical protein
MRKKPVRDDIIPPFWSAARYRSGVRKSRKLDDDLLLAYADAAGTGMAVAFDDYRKDRDAKSLDELEAAMLTLAAVVTVLRSRVLPDS